MKGAQGGKKGKKAEVIFELGGVWEESSEEDEEE